MNKQWHEVMEALHCERLSKNDKNCDFIEGFFSKRNPRIPEKLLEDGFDEDSAGINNYYIVKNDDNEVLFFFSIKCGQLHEPYLKKEQEQLFDRFARFISGKASDANADEDEKIQAQKIQEKLRSGNGLSKSDVDFFQGKSEVVDKIIQVCNLDQKHVLSTAAGVELVHFCANENKRHAWTLPEKLGISVFWYFIVPIILDVKELVGCSHVFLFAADITEDETLVKYYKQLSFEDTKDKVSVYPSYDEFCRFMYRETKDLASERQVFLDI
jgi:hypothetical protein